MKKVNIFTDGACSGNPGVGGWGAVLVFNGIKKELSGASFRRPEGEPISEAFCKKTTRKA